MATEAALVATRFAEARDTGILDLSNCKLTQIPNSVYIFIKNIEVTVCNLSHNLLVSIPQRLFNECPSLKELNLSYNKLQMLPDQILQLKKLESLNLSCNSFTVLPLCVYQLDLLKELKLQDNQIEDINTELLEAMSSLQRISLEENPLPEDLIDTLDSMESQLVITT